MCFLFWPVVVFSLLNCLSLTEKHLRQHLFGGLSSTHAIFAHSIALCSSLLPEWPNTSARLCTLTCWLYVTFLDCNVERACTATCKKAHRGLCVTSRHGTTGVSTHSMSSVLQVAVPTTLNSYTLSPPDNAQCTTFLNVSLCLCVCLCVPLGWVCPFWERQSLPPPTPYAVHRTQGTQTVVVDWTESQLLELWLFSPSASEIRCS